MQAWRSYDVPALSLNVQTAIKSIGSALDPAVRGCKVEVLPTATGNAFDGFGQGAALCLKGLQRIGASVPWVNVQDK
jgi:hypothetical protein